MDDFFWFFENHLLVDWSFTFCLSVSPGDQRIDRELGGVSETHFRPAFRKIPSDIEVPEGQMARFDCIVTGRPNPDVYWFRDGTEVIHLAGPSMGEKGESWKFSAAPRRLGAPPSLKKYFCYMFDSKTDYLNCAYVNRLWRFLTNQIISWMNECIQYSVWALLCRIHATANNSLLAFKWHENHWP